MIHHIYGLLCQRIRKININVQVKSYLWGSVLESSYRYLKPDIVNTHICRSEANPQVSEPNGMGSMDLCFPVVLFLYIIKLNQTKIKAAIHLNNHWPRYCVGS